MDLRERIVAACTEGASQASVAQRFGVCSKTVQRYVARAARGELAPRPLPGAAPRLRPDQEAAFLSMVVDGAGDEQLDGGCFMSRVGAKKRCAVAAFDAPRSSAAFERTL